MVKKADEYGHNNEDNAFVDGDFVRGGPRKAVDRAALYALVTKADQLKQHVTEVRVLSDAEHNGATTKLLLVDDTNIGNVAGWELVEAGGPSTGPAYTAAALATSEPGFRLSPALAALVAQDKGRLRLLISPATTPTNPATPTNPTTPSTGFPYTLPASLP